MIITSLLLLCLGLGLLAWKMPVFQKNSAEFILPPPPPLPLEGLFPRDTLNDYQDRAMFYHQPGPERLATYALGICGESGEVAEIIKKHLGHGQDVDVEKLTLELGDVLWYISALAHLYQISLEEVAEENLRKLAKRYPTGFVKGGGKR
jgi:NTP pyrophosphatase (non-canonical NTP hydrolase)